MAHAYLQQEWDSATAGDELTVTGEEARHAVKVARLRAGEQILLLNGRGTRVAAEVVQVDATEFRVRATADSVREPEPSPRLVLVQALAKGGRDEMALQAAVELGVDAVLPWQAERSVAKWSPEKTPKQQQRWDTIAREAAKQSMRARIPEILPVATTKQLAERIGQARVLVLDPDGDTGIGELELGTEKSTESPTLALIIGPEGGISPGELDRFRAGGASLVRLGENVLRTSTAGPAAVAAILTKLRRW
ncbi:MAG: 16S rRNA (uracil(1498)-N(3))-methyltransferase [Gulosibacter sp.]|uniref:16S rRNA (uracil(1498)-N(3))-methyltransferase n=1 Tax=Gulosibacter sp. TaxID=2817531 RepID=UPI003F90812F